MSTAGVAIPTTFETPLKLALTGLARPYQYAALLQRVGPSSDAPFIDLGAGSSLREPTLEVRMLMREQPWEASLSLWVVYMLAAVSVFESVAEG